ARAPGVPAQIALALQRRKLIRDAGGAGQADRLANLPHRRGIATALHRIPDDLQDLALPPGEHVVRVRVVGHLRDHEGNASLGLAARPAFGPDRAVPGRSVVLHAAAHVLTSELVPDFSADVSACRPRHQTSVRRAAKMSYATGTTESYEHSIEL